MQRPRDRVEPFLLHGLLALDAQAESAGMIEPERRPDKDEKLPRIAALLEENFLGVATVGLVGHILSADAANRRRGAPL